MLKMVGNIIIAGLIAIIFAHTALAHNYSACQTPDCRAKSTECLDIELIGRGPQNQSKTELKITNCNSLTISRGMFQKMNKYEGIVIDNIKVLLIEERAFSEGAFKSVRIENVAAMDLHKSSFGQLEFVSLVLANVTVSRVVKDAFRGATVGEFQVVNSDIGAIESGAFAFGNAERMEVRNSRIGIVGTGAFCLACGKPSDPQPEARGLKAIIRWIWAKIFGKTDKSVLQKTTRKFIFSGNTVGKLERDAFAHVTNDVTDQLIIANNKFERVDKQLINVKAGKMTIGGNDFNCTIHLCHQLNVENGNSQLKRCSRLPPFFNSSSCTPSSEQWGRVDLNRLYDQFRTQSACADAFALWIEEAAAKKYLQLYQKKEREMVARYNLLHNSCNQSADQQLIELHQKETNLTTRMDQLISSAKQADKMAADQLAKCESSVVAISTQLNAAMDRARRDCESNRETTKTSVRNKIRCFLGAVKSKCWTCSDIKNKSYLEDHCSFTYSDFN